MDASGIFSYVYLRLDLLRTTIGASINGDRGHSSRKSPVWSKDGFRLCHPDSGCLSTSYITSQSLNTFVMNWSCKNNEYSSNVMC